MADAFNAPGVVKPFGIFSSAAWAPQGRLLFVSGHVSQDADGNSVGTGDMRAQTRQCLVNIREVLAAAGGTMDDIAKVTVFVTDVSKIKEVHEARAEFFKKPYPASTLVGVARLIKPEWLIEIEAVAVIPEARVKRPAPSL
jgi:reactive intermediate/imine deaminase